MWMIKFAVSSAGCNELVFHSWRDGIITYGSSKLGHSTILMRGWYSGQSVRDCDANQR